MILDEYVDVYICNFNIKYYTKLGYKTVLFQKLKISIKHLTLGSGLKINVKCDICNFEKMIRYQDYLKIIKNNKDNLYSCSKCRMDKCFIKDGMNISKLESIKEKKKDTFILKYGFDNPSKCVQFQKKKEDTNLKNCGYKYPQQNRDISEKTLKSGFKINYWENGLLYQGNYEKDFLEHCVQMNILDLISKPKSIRYFYNDKKSYYHPDFYIEKLNLIIEIKSDYWYKIHKERNILKENSVKEQGFNFLLILNKDYTEFDEFIF